MGKCNSPSSSPVAHWRKFGNLKGFWVRGKRTSMQYCIFSIYRTFYFQHWKLWRVFLALATFIRWDYSCVEFLDQSHSGVMNMTVTVLFMTNPVHFQSNEESMRRNNASWYWSPSVIMTMTLGTEASPREPRSVGLGLIFRSTDHWETALVWGKRFRYSPSIRTEVPQSVLFLVRLCNQKNDITGVDCHSVDDNRWCLTAQ